MKILVLGGAGYIGSHTAVELLNAGREIVIIDNFSNSKPEVLKKIKKITGKDFKFYEETKLVGSLNSLDYKNAVVCTHENFLRNVYGCPKHTYLIGVLNDKNKGFLMCLGTL